MTETSLRHQAGFDARIALLAARQANAVSRAQAHALGATDPVIQRRLRSGRWARRYPGVYVIAGSPPSWIQDVWCAYLAAGSRAALTHETALRLHGVDELPRHPITLTAPHGAHSRLSRVFVHQIDDLWLHPHRLAKVGGLPVSTVERAAVEIAATAGEVQLARVIDDVLTQRRTTVGRLAACFREVLRPGKPGMVKVAKVLEARGDGYIPPQSELERALFSALAAGGLPRPRRQLPLPGRGAVAGTVDAAYVEVKVILEADGRRWHARIDALRRDHQRDTEAARVGWLTLRFVYEQIVHEPHEICAAVADVLSVRGMASVLRR